MKTKNGMKLWTVTLVTASTLAFVASACSDAQEPLEKSTDQAKEVFTKADKMPEYPGGMPALVQYMTEHLTYPKSEKNRGTEGTVHVAFVVDTEGRVTDISIERSVSKDLDEAAADIVSKMPDWTPGEKDGKKVSVKMVLPVKFAMNS